MTLAVLTIFALFAASAADSDSEDKPNAVRKVITLIEEMKAQVEKEGEEDKTAYDAYACWCKTNDAEKTAAIENAEKRIADLTSAIEGFAALKAKLMGEIEKLEQDIADANKLWKQRLLSVPRK